MARRLTAPARFLRARSLSLVAYGETGSSLVFALGIVAFYALGLTPWVLLAVGILILVVTLSYAEGVAAVPEAGGAATFVRRAFSDPAGFVTGWVLFLDYLVVISLAALFVPHYVGEALGWEKLAERPWDAIAAIAVIVTLAALRRVLRGERLVKVAVVSAGDRPLRVAAALGARVRAGVLGRLAQRGGRPRHRAVVGLHRPGPVARDAGLHRPRDGHQLRRRGPRAGPHAAAEPVRGDRRRRGGQPPGGDRGGLGLPRGGPTRARPTAWPAASGSTGSRPRWWASRPSSATTCPTASPRRLEVFIGLSAALVLVTAIVDLPGRSRAAGVLDGPLRDAAPRLRPPRARRRAHRGGHPRRHRDRRRPPDHLRRRGRRGAVPGEPLQLRGAHRADGRPGGRGAPAHPGARASSAPSGCRGECGSGARSCRYRR